MNLPPLPVWGGSYTADQLRDYATAAVLAEREAIAQMLDQWQEDAGSMHNYWAFAARQIRARGE